MNDECIEKTTDTNGTFFHILQKHCAGNLFLTGIFLYAAGNVLTMLAVYGLMGVFPLLFLILPVVGLLLVNYESKHRHEPKNTLRVLKFFKICCVVLLVFFVINIPFAINDMFRGGNFAALSAFYSLIFSIPYIAYLVSLLRIITGMEKGIRKNERSRLRGVLPVTIWGGIMIILEFLHVGLFTAFARDIFLLIIWLTQGIAVFGISPPVSGLGFVNMTGAIIFIVVLNRFNRDLIKDTDEP